MKTILITFAIGGSLCCTPMLAEDTNAPAKNISPDRVSVFQVPWQCPAAAQIGCGSHAKPILLELEQDPTVSEAWLNRAGTKLAVVWQPESKAKARRSVATKFKEQEANEIKGKPRDEAITEFQSGKGWYRGAEVDRLSEEEAGIIAARWMRRLQAKTTLSEEKSKGLRAALTEGLKKCLTGKVAMPESDEEKARELRRVASPFLDEKQTELLLEAAGCGFRALPNED